MIDEKKKIYKALIEERQFIQDKFDKATRMEFNARLHLYLRLKSINWLLNKFFTY